jgi:hypothetical protein
MAVLAENKNITIIQGDSSDPITIRVSGVSDYGGYSARLAIYHELGETALLTKAMTLDTDRFVAQIDPDESESLSRGNYHLVITIEHSGNNFKRERQHPLIVKERGEPIV